MRLLFYSSMGGEPWGGSEELWSRAAMRALDEGDTVAVSVFSFDGAQVRQIEALRERGALILARKRRPSLLERLSYARRVAQSLSNFRPDAACLSQGSAYECVGRRLTRGMLRWLDQTRTPFINLIQFNEPKYDLRQSTIERSRRLFNLASVNAFVAERNATVASATLRMQIPRPRIVRNPVNLKDTSPLPWPEGGMLRMACVGRLHVDAKGQDMLLAALGTRAWKDQDWMLTLAGAGRDESSLREQVRALGLTRHVTFAGQVPDLRELWSTHHLLVLPSRAEGTPLAMVEAMLLGRPALVTDVGGCAEWVSSANGFPCEPTMPEIAKALDRAWAARPVLHAMGALARATALQHHDPDAEGTLLALLRSITRR